MPQAQGPRSLILFAIAISVLLLNDHVLKFKFPGVVTGKLSDVAGLFAVGMFVATMFPAQAKRICTLVALVFVVWKSPASETCISLWNELFSHQIARVVDATDLIALAVLPIGVRYRIAPGKASERLLTLCLCVSALFAFAGTSVARYRMDVPKQSTLRHITITSSLTDTVRVLTRCGFTVRQLESEESAGQQRVMIASSMRMGTGTSKTVHAWASVYEIEGKSVFAFERIEIWRPDIYVDEARVLTTLESRIRGCLGPGT